MVNQYLFVKRKRIPIGRCMSDLNRAQSKEILREILVQNEISHQNVEMY